MSKLTEQISVRVTPEFRAYLQKQVSLRQKWDEKVTEGDALRACILYAMQDNGADQMLLTFETEGEE